LQETTEARLLLHVIDAASEERSSNTEQVVTVLQEIGAQDTPVLEVYNKVDLLDSVSPRIDRDDQGRPLRVWLSAQRREGGDLLLQAISELLRDDVIHRCLLLAPGEGYFRSQLYAQGAVLSERVDEQGELELEVRLQKRDLLQVLSRVGIAPERYFKVELECDGFSLQAPV
jgi:GTP-binding protein HflX